MRINRYGNEKKMISKKVKKEIRRHNTKLIENVSDKRKYESSKIENVHRKTQNNQSKRPTG